MAHRSWGTAEQRISHKRPASLARLKKISFHEQISSLAKRCMTNIKHQRSDGRDSAHRSVLREIGIAAAASPPPPALARAWLVLYPTSSKSLFFEPLRQEERSLGPKKDEE
jgi:hypothetical protein